MRHRCPPGDPLRPSEPVKAGGPTGLHHSRVLGLRPRPSRGYRRGWSHRCPTPARPPHPPRPNYPWGQRLPAFWRFFCVLPDLRVVFRRFFLCTPRIDVRFVGFKLVDGVPVHGQGRSRDRATRLPTTLPIGEICGQRARSAAPGGVLGGLGWAYAPMRHRCPPGDPSDRCLSAIMLSAIRDRRMPHSSAPIAPRHMRLQPHRRDACCRGAWWARRAKSCGVDGGRPGAKPRAHFPSRFLWGTATAAYQVVL